MLIKGYVSLTDTVLKLAPFIMFGFCIAAIMTMLVMRKDLKEVCIRADQTEVVVFTAYEAEQESTVGRDPHKIQ